MLSTLAILSAASAVIATPLAPRVPTSCPGGIVECVVEGDTLFKIAESNGLDLEQLTIANPQFTDIDEIYPKDRVCIPDAICPQRKAAQCVGEILTLVEYGDTLANLAASNNLDLTVLIAVNPQLGPNYDLIFAGDEVCKPKSCPSYKAEVKAVSKYVCIKDDVAPVTEVASNATIAAPSNTTVPTYYASEPVTRDSLFPASCDGDNVQVECVVPGDNLDAMAMRHGITLASIKQANPQFSEDFDLIFPGDKVCISKEAPARTAAECDGDILTRVVCGDTLYELALANDLSLETLIEANPQLGPNYDLIFPGDEVCKPKNCPSFQGEEKVEATKYDIDNKTVGSKIDEGYSVSQLITASSASTLLASAVVVVALMF